MVAVSARQWRLNDYYAVLGVSPRASDEEIDVAFRALAKRWHPDRCAGDAQATERFKEITAAHDVVGDPRRRVAYDRERALAAASARPQGGPASPRQAPTPGSGGRPAPTTVNPRQAPADSHEWAGWTAPARARVRRPRRFHPLLVLSVGALLLVSGVLLAAWRLTVGRAGASFGAAAARTSGVILDVNGRRQVQFRAGDGRLVTARPAGAATDSTGSTVRVVYDRDQPSRVVLDHDSFAKEFTIWFAAVKLVVGGAALMVVSRSQRLRRWIVEHTRAHARAPATRVGA